MDKQLRQAFMGSIKKWAKLKTQGYDGNRSTVSNCDMCDHIHYQDEYLDRDADCNADCHLTDICEDPYRNYIIWMSKHNARVMHKLIIDKYLEIRRD